MNPDGRFLKQPKSFWANVRTISEQAGYTERSTRQVKIPTLEQVMEAYRKIGLSTTHIVRRDTNKLTSLGALLFEYFQYRADILNNYVQVRLMDVAKARAVYQKLSSQLAFDIKMPMNKQTGVKKDTAFFTAIIILLIKANAEGLPCDFDPHVLTTVTRNNEPLRTLARRVDGAFTSTVNPIAVWEIKEYYYTTTFGSRVADGVYESLLDGMELEELQEHENVPVKHYLMIDGFKTWWQDGRSYLCRMVDMVHMGYVDEVLFGYEVVERLPSIVKNWVDTARQHPELVSSKGQDLPSRLPSFE